MSCSDTVDIPGDDFHKLFYGYRFREITWLVNISSERAGDMVCPELEDDYFEERIELGDEWVELDRICIDMFIRVPSCYNSYYLASASSDLLSG